MTTTATKTRSDYDTITEKLNAKYPAVKAEVRVSPHGGRLEIEVASVKQATALREMFHGFTFTSGTFK